MMHWMSRLWGTGHKESVSKLDVAVDTSSSISDSFNLLDKYNYDIVLLDRLLDDGDGIEIAEYLHDVSFNTKIIMISNIGDIDNRIKGLQTGADLYLSKPFDRRELLLLVTKLLQAEKLQPDSFLSLGDLNFSDNTGEVSANKFSCRLRKKEAEILRLLIIRKNQTVTREQIIDGVWGSRTEIPTYSTIDAYIRKIRVSLQDYSYHIKTIRGFGYSAID